MLAGREFLKIRKKKDSIQALTLLSYRFPPCLGRQIQGLQLAFLERMGQNANFFQASRRLCTPPPANRACCGCRCLCFLSATGSEGKRERTLYTSICCLQNISILPHQEHQGGNVQIPCLDVPCRFTNQHQCLLYNSILSIIRVQNELQSIPKPSGPINFWDWIILTGLLSCMNWKMSHAL